jgi:hypothetical protein
MKLSNLLTPFALVAVTATAHAQLLSDASFDAIALGNYAPSSALGAWTVDGSHSGVIVSNIGIGGSNCVVFEDLYDTDPTSSKITQTATGLIPGQAYLLGFYTSGFAGFLDPDSGVPVDVSVSVNGADTSFGFNAYYSNGEGPGMGSNPWVYRSVQFIADETSEVIIFEGSNPGYSASTIDSVSVTAIPEFSSTGVIFGLVSLTVFSLKRSERNEGHRDAA